MNEKKMNIDNRKWDCFAFNHKTCRCICLKENYCDYEDCSFYKPESEVDKKEISMAIKAYAETHGC